MPKQPSLTRRIESGRPCRLFLIRLDAWHRACDAAGLLTDEQRAAALRMGRQQVNLVQNRQKTPGVEFVVAALRLFPQLGFDDLFATYDNTDTVAS